MILHLFYELKEIVLMVFWGKKGEELLLSDDLYLAIFAGI